MFRFTRLLLTAALLAAGSGAAQAQVVISQVYGGGGNSGSTYTNDFIEIFNAGSTAQNLNGWSVQYASSSGTSWQVTNLGNVNLQPGQYYLVQEAQGSGGTTPLPTPDATGTIAMSGSSGKVILAKVTTAQSGTACPSGADIADLVGFGSANCPNPTGGLSAVNAAIRKGGGCTNTGNPTADFDVAPAAPRNTATATAQCAGSGTPAISVADVALDEGDTGLTPFVFTVQLSEPAPVGGVSFSYATANDT
ncbi:MAG: lamin tail domain-containing protein, partial [Xanthomonadales bacterium]|nr:lamin tail domain-containing protein [Xanthomonadales bacterium]